MTTTPKQVLLSDFKPTRLLNRSDHTPNKAKFPVIDAHNHLFEDMSPESLIEIMDAVGVTTWINVTGNASMPVENNAYTIVRRPFREFAERYMAPYPGRFAAFTMAEFARWENFTLFEDDDFAEQCVKTLEEDVEMGACGLKVTKELGLRFTDRNGAMIPVDDERLAPVWRRAGELDVPALLHISDPAGFFLPIDKRNEHYLTLSEFPDWAFNDAHFDKMELLRQRNRLIARHPETTFILPHVANHAENLASVARLLDEHPNVTIDFSARIDELGRQPYTARDFIIRYQDRILFGLDMPVSVEAYRCYFRFLETRDEYFEYPDYIGRFGKSVRWKIYGLSLADEVLKKIYYDNVIQTVPRLAAAVNTEARS